MTKAVGDSVLTSVTPKITPTVRAKEAGTNDAAGSLDNSEESAQGASSIRIVARFPSGTAFRRPTEGLDVEVEAWARKLQPPLLRCTSSTSSR
jgi:hypothetical protein